jgi:hypothetical protein
MYNHAQKNKTNRYKTQSGAKNELKGNQTSLRQLE